MRDELLSLTELAVELAKRAGATDAWASAGRSRDVEIAVRDGKLEKVQESTSRGLSVQLYVHGRYSSNHTTDLRPKELERFVRDAVAITHALERDEDRLMPDPALFAPRAPIDLDLVDRDVVELTREERLALAMALNAQLAVGSEVISRETTVSSGHGMTASSSSNGFRGSHERSGLWLGASVTLDDGDKRPAGAMWGGARHRADVPPAEEIADAAMARARARLGAKKGPTAKTVMVVDRSAAARLLGRLLSPASAHSLQQGRSFYADRLGTPMFSPVLTITDEPLLPRALGSRHFDGEGIAAKAMPVIERGVVKNVYADTHYARKLHLAPTSGSASNRLVALGSRGLSQMVADTSTGVYVEGWLGGNADATTGDFSLGGPWANDPRGRAR